MNEGNSMCSPYYAVRSKTINVTESTLNLTNGTLYGADSISLQKSEITVKSVWDSAISTDNKIKITDCTVYANSEVRGAGIDSYGDIDIRNSVVTAAGASGSIYAVDADNNDKNVNITNSWVACTEEIQGNSIVNNAVLFIGTAGTVIGKATVPRNVEVVQGSTLTVPENATLTIPSGIKLTNNGTINAYCTSIKGTVTGTAPVITHGKLTGWLTDKSSHWKECSRCKTKFEKAAHSFIDWKTTEKNVLGKSGSRERTCTVCKYVQKETIPAIKVMTLRVTGGKKTVSLKWNKVSGADGYMIYGSKCGNKYKYALKKVVSKNTTSWTDKKLETGKYYRYYVVAYKMQDGKKVVIGKSGDMHTATLGRDHGYTSKITVNKSSFRIKKGKTARIKAYITNTNDNVENHVARIRYVSTNAKVATVNNKGKVKAKAKGTCYVYCYGMNGLMKRVKITVK